MDRPPPRKMKCVRRLGKREREELSTALRVQLKRIETAHHLGKTCVRCDMWFSDQTKGDVFADSHEIPIPFNIECIEDIIRDALGKTLIGLKPEDISEAEWREKNPLLFCITGQGDREYTETSLSEAVSRGYGGMTLKRKTARGE
jgi:hypothetical protein